MVDYKILQKEFAFKEGVINNSNELKKELIIKCNELNDKRINEKTWWSNGFKGTFEKKGNSTWYDVILNGEIIDSVFDIDRLLELKERILSFGGNDICLDSCEEDLTNILKRGQLWLNKRGRIIKMKGKLNQCHQNSCELWENNKDSFNIHICTGYALCKKDSLWRQHSWLVYINEDLNNPQPQIIETTVDWSAYYGYVMTSEECEKFSYQNI